jgi:hypothetical protein
VNGDRCALGRFVIGRWKHPGLLASPARLYIGKVTEIIQSSALHSSAHELDRNLLQVMAIDTLELERYGMPYLKATNQVILLPRKVRFIVQLSDVVLKSAPFTGCPLHCQHATRMRKHGRPLQGKWQGDRLPGAAPHHNHPRFSDSRRAKRCNCAEHCTNARCTPPAAFHHLPQLPA